MGQRAPSPDSLPPIVTLSPPRGNHDYECSDAQQIPLAIEPVPDVIVNEEVKIPIVEQHKKNARGDVNVEPTLPDSDRHLADESTFILLENPNAEPDIKVRPKTPNPTRGEEWASQTNSHLHIAKGEPTKPHAIKNAYNETTDANATEGIPLAYLDVANKKNQ